MHITQRLEQKDPGHPGPNPQFLYKEWELKVLKDNQKQIFQTLMLPIYFEVHLLSIYLRQDSNYILQT